MNDASIKQRAMLIVVINVNILRFYKIRDGISPSIKDKIKDLRKDRKVQNTCSVEHAEESINDEEYNQSA